MFNAIPCGKQDPQGVFSGEIKDWVHEVFTGPIVSGGKEGKIILTLRQTPDGSTAEMVFEHPQIGSSQRVGKWEVGDGEREIRFNDGRGTIRVFSDKKRTKVRFSNEKRA